MLLKSGKSIWFVKQVSVLTRIKYARGNSEDFSAEGPENDEMWESLIWPEKPTSVDLYSDAT